MTAHDALVVAAAVLLPGTAFIAARVAFTTWRQGRRRRGPWVVASVRRVTGEGVGL